MKAKTAKAKRQRRKAAQQHAQRATSSKAATGGPPASGAASPLASLYADDLNGTDQHMHPRGHADHDDHEVPNSRIRVDDAKLVASQDIHRPSDLSLEATGTPATCAVSSDEQLTQQLAEKLADAPGVEIENRDPEAGPTPKSSLRNHIPDSAPTPNQSPAKAGAPRASESRASACRHHQCRRRSHLEAQPPVCQGRCLPTTGLVPRPAGQDDAIRPGSPAPSCSRQEQAGHPAEKGRSEPSQQDDFQRL